MLLETVFDEAVNAFQSVLEPRAQQPPRTPSSRPEVAEKATQIRQPPNSPDNVANPTATFTFEINDSDGFESDAPPPPVVPKVTVTNAEVTEAAASGNLQRLRRCRRSLRKRPRKPSFKAHRVPPKFSCCEDADDEASSSSDESSSTADQVDSSSIDLIKLHRISITDNHDDSSSSSSEEIFAESSGLQLRLKVLSEAQRTVEEAASVVTDWAKVGAELRSIADKFGDDNDDGHGHLDEVDGEGRRVVARHEVDVVSLINLMLPFSVPQSLWSALVSYAAWKIFKRFQ